MQSEWQNNARLSSLVSDLVVNLDPHAIYLFGSHARGEARQDSDYDLFVVVDDEIDKKKITLRNLYRFARENHLMADVIACRKNRFELLRNQVGSLSYEVNVDGVALYAR